MQEQLRRRSEEIALRHKEITDQLQTYQTKFGELESRTQELDQPRTGDEAADRNLAHRTRTQGSGALETARRSFQLRRKASGETNQLALQQKSHADERAQFHLERQSSLDKLAQAKAELEDAAPGGERAFLQQIPDAELRKPAAAVDRLSHAREQLRNHLGEIHEYVRQCQDELEQLRVRLQEELDKLQGHEHMLRRTQDEHRLATAAIRQQLIDWQGQIFELKRLLSRDETRLGRKQADVDERAKGDGGRVATARATRGVEFVQEQEREVADRRQEMDRHLVDMREWYRRKLRELAGIPLVPDTTKSNVEPTILPVPNLGDAAEDGIVPTGRSILSIAGAADQGDQKLGEILRTSQLIDSDTLNALLAEARRQRRSLRQVLLASGVITLYQLALIEAGNVHGLMIGPVRIIDRSAAPSTRRSIASSIRAAAPRRSCATSPTPT